MLLPKIYMLLLSNADDHILIAYLHQFYLLAKLNEHEGMAS